MTDIETYEQQLDGEKPAKGGELISSETTSLARPSELLPGVLHVLPLANRPFFPAQMAPLVLEQDPWLRTIEAAAESSQKFLGLVLVSTDNLSAAQPSDFHSMGTACRIHKIHTLEDKMQVYVEGLQRFRIEEWVSKDRKSVV